MLLAVAMSSFIAKQKLTNISFSRNICPTHNKASENSLRFFKTSFFGKWASTICYISIRGNMNELELLYCSFLVTNFLNVLEMFSERLHFRFRKRRPRQILKSSIAALVWQARWRRIATPKRICTLPLPLTYMPCKLSLYWTVYKRACK